MKRFSQNLFTVISVFVLSNITAAATPWPPKIDGIENDPAVKYGVLENGVRWAYLPNAHPEEQLSLRLIVETGSFMEEDDEVGIAHFLEHMAFNGTEHFPEAGQVVETFPATWGGIWQPVERRYPGFCGLCIRWICHRLVRN